MSVLEKNAMGALFVSCVMLGGNVPHDGCEQRLVKVSRCLWGYADEKYPRSLAFSWA